MRPSDERLIRRLQQRNADRERATDGRIHSREPFPPATVKAIQGAERAIGFKLPELLRATYLKVGNGGFGPAYGIVGTKRGAMLDGCTLETGYEDSANLVKDNSVWRWP